MENLFLSRLHKVDGTNGGNKMEQLSGVMIIVIIGGGVLTFVTLFIFAKRQIMRFTIRSRRGPHVPVGMDARKSIRLEIERRLDCVQRIAYEPKLLWNDDKFIVQPEQPLQPYYWRMRAVDDVKILEKAIGRNDGCARQPHDSLRAFLLVTLAGTLDGNGQRLIHQYCDMYEHARHDPNEFGKEEYEAYHRLFLKLIDSARMLKSLANSRKTSPSRTPYKKHTKTQSLLDPSRLRPPPSFHASAGSLSTMDTATRTMINPTGTTIDSQTQYNSRTSLALGLQKDSCTKLDALHDSSNLVFRKGGGLSYLGLQKDCDSFMGLRKNNDDSYLNMQQQGNDDDDNDDNDRSNSSLTVRKDSSNSSLVKRQDSNEDAGKDNTMHVADIHIESSFTFEQPNKAAGSNTSLDCCQRRHSEKQDDTKLPDDVRLEDDTSEQRSDLFLLQ